MSSISETLQGAVIQKAIEDATVRDDFRLSRWTSVLTGEQNNRIFDDIASILGATGYIGTIYVEQADLGNGNQDVGAPRINIEQRSGRIVNEGYLRRMGSSTIGILRQFPPQSK